MEIEEHTIINMKKVFLLLMMLVVANVMYSQEYDGITLTMTDGTTTIVRLAGERPVIKFVDDKFVITTADATTEFNRSDIARLNYNEGAGVETINQDDIAINNIGDALIVTGLPANSNIMVYSIDGRLISNEKSNDETFVLQFNSLSKGVYIVSVNGVSTKISITR